jgi:Matrixin.
MAKTKSILATLMGVLSFSLASTFSPVLAAGPYADANAATLAPIAAPTQDISAVSDILGDGVYSWPVDRLPLKVYIPDGTGVASYRSDFPQVLRECFDDWAVASGNRVAWQEVGSAEEADIVVKWRSDSPARDGGNEAGLTRTYTKYNTRTKVGTIYKADMGLVTRLPYRELSDLEIKKTFLHECGHALGLAGHSHERGDIMFAKVSPSQQPFLNTRDIDAIMAVYGRYPQRNASASAPRSSTIN